MNKKYLPVLIFLAFLFSIQVLALKEDKYDQWLKKEVNLIISDAEKEELKKLIKDKDKEKFIAIFWAKRDPTPRTDKNEFREEYYKRLEYIKTSFIYGYKKGIETDMGKVYLYFGKPLNVSRQSQVNEVWVYPSRKWMKMPKNTYSIVFTKDENGYVIDRSRTNNRAMQAFYAYPKQTLLFPDLNEVPEYKKVFSFSPDSLEKKLIKQVISTGQDQVQIPFEEKAFFIKAQNQSSFLTFLFKITPEEKQKDSAKKLVFFSRLVSEAFTEDFRQELNLEAEDGAFFTQVGFPAMPGEFTLFLGFYTPDNKLISIKSYPLTVPSFWGQELAVSSLLASPQVSQDQPSKDKEDFNIFSLGQYSLNPHISQEYTKEDNLNVFYHIYNIAANDKQICSLLIEFELIKEGKTYALNPQKREEQITASATILDGTSIPLSYIPESGEYEFVVTVTDKVANKTTSQKMKFVLK